MRLFEINSVSYGSTGRIMFQIAEKVEEQGGVAYTASSFTKNRGEVFPKNYVRIGNALGKLYHIVIAKKNGKHGAYSKYATKRLIRKIEEANPDVIHLHNLHGWFLNYQLFTDYLKRCGKPVVWTLHDCWAFTGQCPHFTMAKCDKWKYGCYDCPQYRQYPESYVDRTKTMWKLKKKWFTGIQNMTIVTPSHWLATLVKESYLKEYPVKVIHNGIDLDVFQPTPSDFKQQYHCEQKYVVLGVAFGWGKRKGLDVFIELAKRLDTERYQIVLVGTDEKIDKSLPENIISIHCTQNQKELAEIYTAADVFANPTREENYPTVNMEALACGTSVITFDTGGSPEILDETCGMVVNCDDVEALERGIIKICETKVFTKENCLERAKGFDKNQRFEEYVELYKSVY